MFLVIGLDGATLDLIEPLARAGKLPHLSSLMERGAFGRLTVPMPPVTFPSWTSFMTGVNPGRHGIFDFTRRENHGYDVRFVNSSFRKSPTIWRILSDLGKRVCSLGIPGNYPPEEVNGYTLSGFDTPVTTRADASFAYPPEFADVVNKAGGFPFADFQEFSIDEGWHERAFASMCSAIDRKTELALTMIGREAFDCFMIMFGESDTVAHHFWSLHDEASPRFSADLRSRLGDCVAEIYRRLDDSVGRLVDAAKADHVMIVSDHGFGGVGDVALHLNRWLEESGFLTWSRSRSSNELFSASRWAGRIRQAAVRSIPERLQAPLFRVGGGRFAGALESRVRFGGIDWQGTRAFSEELNYAPAIWLNVAGREPGGTVPHAGYEDACSELTQRLMEWHDPYNGGNVVRRVYRRGELFHGPQVRYAPDLVLDLELHGGYSYVCLPSLGRSGPSIRKLSGTELDGGKLVGMSGSHRRQGVFMLAGEGVNSGRMRGVEMVDLAPTLLGILGVESAEGDFDGRCLECVTSRMEVGESQPRTTPLKLGPENYYDKAEEDDLRERLERLGYL